MDHWQSICARHSGEQRHHYHIHKFYLGKGYSN